MEPICIKVTQADGYETSLWQYPAATEVSRGSLLVLHGMAEHHLRYEAFAEVLNQAGITVYLYNHRGHGTHLPVEELGFFAEKDGSELLINDAIHLCKYVKSTCGDTKFAVMGHSMGSLVLRNVLQRYDEMDLAIVCATTMPPVAVSKVGYTLANFLCKVQGSKRRSDFLNNVMFGGGLYKDLCKRTPVDWLTRDEAIVDAYIADPYCGFICTTSMYRDIIKFTINAADKKLINRTRKDLPIYLIAGDKDPVGGYGTQIEALNEIFLSLGFENVTQILFGDCRHELLNELNKEDVYDEILDALSTIM